ncbi:MAG: DUF1003 domain-containing protein [Candidatus Coprovivens sp.]
MESNNINKRALVKKLLKQEFLEEQEDELIEMLIDKPISIDVDKIEDSNASFGDKVADKVAEVAGSWTFIICFGLFLAIWIIFNVIIFNNDSIDPYPFILLNLILSCLSALQAPLIMMSQNRQAKKDSLRSQNDYQVDLKSELILEDIHDDIVKIIKTQNEILKRLDEKEK